MDFASLKIDSRVIDILKSQCIEVATEVQAKTYPLAANGHDVIGVSKTGSGKTLAFVLPTVNQFLLSDKPFHTLILTPTRELALQTAQCLSLFHPLGLRHALLVGGEPLTPQAQALSKYPHVVVGTVGRVAKHIEKTKGFKIQSIRKLVLDEADRFFEQDFTKDLDLIMARLEKKNQTLMFTATLTEQVRSLSGIFMKSPHIIGHSSGAPDAPENSLSGVETLKESFVFVPEKYKIVTLCNYIRTHASDSIIVFVGMCITTHKVGSLLKKLEASCEYINGKMPQKTRMDIVQQFRDRRFNVLVATDLASRGLDIPQVCCVINFDLPVRAKDYIHRVGRTARAGRSGQALTLVTQYDVARLQKLEHAMKRRIDKIDMDLFYDAEPIMSAYSVISTEHNERLGSRR